MVKILNPQSNELFNELVCEGRVVEYLQELRKLHCDSYDHSRRVGLLSIDLGYENRVNGMNLRHIGYGGLLHDIGKLRVPKEILTKGSGLDEEEWDIISGHPRLGFLESQDLGYEEVRQIIVAHHEYKVKPYPRTGDSRRKQDRTQEDRRHFDENITLAAQIVAVSDIYDALTSKREYKEELGKQDVERILREQFTGDQRFVDQVLARN
jgi:HD-GYP domain-containing protein (c-di-GMP phosphodiesterase class II)